MFSFIGVVKNIVLSPLNGVKKLFLGESTPKLVNGGSITNLQKTSQNNVDATEISNFHDNFYYKKSPLQKAEEAQKASGTKTTLSTYDRYKNNSRGLEVF